MDRLNAINQHDNSKHINLLNKNSYSFAKVAANVLTVYQGKRDNL